MDRFKKVVFVVGCFLLVLHACKKEETFIKDSIPVNPYDTVTYPPPPVVPPVDSTSFLGIHQYIFSSTCAVPGCHDGSFEPDFRTVQSAYNTLVYHPVEKNNAGGDFSFRVVPGDPTLSWLHYRITTDDAVLGRMPLYDTLSKHEIALIKNWIEGGAEDIFGNSPTRPNALPSAFGLLAFENDTSGQPLHAARASIIDPIVFPKNTTVDVWVGLYDQDDSGNPIPAFEFTHNKYKISKDLFGFNGVTEQSLIVEPALSPFVFGPPGNKAPYYHHFIVNTSDYVVGQTQYFRIYVKDADHPTPTEIPSDGSQLYLLTFFSFVVQ
ncbi:MAG: hypothetical protein RIE58_06540 [Vicingaceae bacterium]